MTSVKLRTRTFEPPARWHVTSDSRPDETHVVDVLAFNGFGECSCEHFQYRMLPELQKAAAGEHVTLSRCKHIEAAREAFADFMIQKLLDHAR